MTPLLFLLTAAAGGVGAALRFVLDGVIRSRVSTLPIGTLVINVSGSFVLGLVTALALGRVVPPEALTVLGVGLMGGFTTFSTASFETVRLVGDRRYGAALAVGVGMIVASVLAAALGLWLGSLV
ncbi:CrcB protein [Marisediminicola sp. UYEF4]|uniref:fluoride efflux transporter CrcB n=1 Tax=Marisediminicola sp. UYEF4 TaxID=1756384 RepID=UPI0033918297